MMRTHRSHLVALVGVALVSSVAGPALAEGPARAPAKTAPAKKKATKPLTDADAAPKEPTREERIGQARKLIAAAEAKLAAGDAAGALADYRAANDVIRSPQAVFGIAICTEKTGTRTEAEDAFHRFLGMPPPESMIDEKHIAEDHLADLGKGTLRISSQPKAIQIALDGSPGFTTPVELRLLPGKHAVVASAPDYEPATNEVEVTKGGVMELSVSLRNLPPSASPAAPPANPSLPPPPSAPISPVLAGGIAVGLAAVGVGVGTAFGVRALSARSDYNRTPTQDLADKTQTSAIVCDSALAGAVVFAVVGAVFLTYRAPVPTTTARLSLAPVVSPHVQGAAALLQF